MSDIMDSIQFFVNLAEKLGSQLHNDQEKSTAKLWIEKLQELKDYQQLQYLKLFIFSLQKNVLQSALGQSVPATHQKMMKILEHCSEFLTSDERDTLKGKLGRISTAISGDLREYFALQEIDNTFIHGYYGISCDEPILKRKLWETPDFDMILNDEKFIINEIDDFLLNNEYTIKVDDKVEDLCQCKNNLKNKVSIESSRPCWGRNRYIERLIDQSPHTVGDLEVAEVDAMLHNFRNRRQKQ